MKFIKELTNIKESKVSALMFFFIPTMAIGLYLAITRGDVPPNLAYIIMTMIGGITGVNVFMAGKSGTMSTGNIGNMMGGYGGYSGYNSYGYGQYGQSNYSEADGQSPDVDQGN